MKRSKLFLINIYMLILDATNRSINEVIGILDEVTVKQLII